MKPLATNESIGLIPAALKKSVPISTGSGAMRFPRLKLLSKTIRPKTPKIEMQQTAEHPVVRKTIVVNADIHQAFEVFTQNMGQWWPKEHHIGGSPMLAVVVEPRSGGRWDEQDEDGSGIGWGTRVGWDHATRLIL